MTMIPKIIHTCWFGERDIPNSQKEYIEGWKKLNPDYEIIIWNEEKIFKYFKRNSYIDDCIANKRYAFLSDLFRLDILYEFGGIYLDTDVEILKSFDDFLNCKMFMGFIFDWYIGTAVIGSEAKNTNILKLKENLFDNYETTGKFIVNNKLITKYFIDNFDDFFLNGKRQTLKSGIELYPKEYFERIKISKKDPGGFSVHHCVNSWRQKTTRKKNFQKFFIKIIGKKKYEKLVRSILCKKIDFYQVCKEKYKKDKKRK